MGKRMPLHLMAPLALLVGVASCQSADRERQTADVIGPVTFHCDDDSQIVAIFDNSRDPATARLVRGDQRAVVPQAVSADGARYVRRGHHLLEQGRRRDGRVARHEPRLHRGGVTAPAPQRGRQAQPAALLRHA